VMSQFLFAYFDLRPILLLLLLQKITQYPWTDANDMIT